jgi:hypothetical protein
MLHLFPSNSAGGVKTKSSNTIDLFPPLVLKNVPEGQFVQMWLCQSLCALTRNHSQHDDAARKSDVGIRMKNSSDLGGSRAVSIRKPIVVT